jgi:hypothetical protein
MNLSFYGHQFRWTFLLADMQLPIIGADFLRHFRLVVDLATCLLLDTKSIERFGPQATVGGSPLTAHILATQP